MTTTDLLCAEVEQRFVADPDPLLRRHHLHVTDTGSNV